MKIRYAVGGLCLFLGLVLNDAEAPFSIVIPLGVIAAILLLWPNPKHPSQ